MNPKTSKKLVALIALLLAVIMIGTTIMGTLSVAFAASKTELKNQKNELAKQKKAVEAAVEELRGKEESYLKLIYALDAQIDLTELDIAATEDIIESLDDDIVDKNTEIEETQAELEHQTVLFETRMRVMYENGSLTYLDVLLSATSFSDMLTRLEQVSQIMEFDQKVIDRVKELKAQLEAQKLELEEAKAEQETYKAELEDKYEELDAQRAEYQDVVDKLEADQEEKERQIAEIEGEMDDIDDELARIAKEEAAKAAAAAGKSSSSYKYNLQSGELLWPCPVYTRISDSYGWRYHPIYKTQKFHKGTDIASGAGNPVLAAKAGTVSKSYFSSSYGNYIVINHGGGLMTAYAHMSTRLVQVGDKVSAGQKIGTVGSTGASTGNHLHYEVYVNGSTVNPLSYY
ncbi:MAG: peptidoglycan DD-metalloendopeptidase family protein [Butyricicoccus sp.]|nr:peptidoglycan DD-metalloendopeptidase family protein [Butyricicoccus sp.]